ncbi:MAG TPA: FAD-dependent oxidoreductase [Microscillaceae bacterium]|nr:FAD-dependent oxidoreductase [Microscillaceae bacterium]
MQVDYLIVGQGIAGTTLSYTLLQQGKRVMVVDAPHPNTSSRVAGGICNPITGRKLVKTWMADALFPFLQKFYQDLEQTLQTRFFYDRQVYRIFKSIEQQNQLLGKSAEKGWEHFFNTEVDNQPYAAFIDNSLDGWETKQGAWLDTAALINAYGEYLKEINSYREALLAYDDIEVTPEGVRWKDVEAQKLVFCQGMEGKHNPYFQDLPFRLVKGELLHIKIAHPPLENIITHGIFMLPLPDTEGEYLVGATYDWQDLSNTTTDKARDQLQAKLDKWLKLPYEILGQRAGVRPATADRRPLIGTSPAHPQIGFFNGLGAKGVSLAPYYAHHFVAHLEQGTTLQAEVDIKRYN